MMYSTMPAPFVSRMSFWILFSWVMTVSCFLFSIARVEGTRAAFAALRPRRSRMLRVVHEAAPARVGSHHARAERSQSDGHHQAREREHNRVLGEHGAQLVPQQAPASRGEGGFASSA